MIVSNLSDLRHQYPELLAMLDNPESSIISITKHTALGPKFIGNPSLDVKRQVLDVFLTKRPTAEILAVDIVTEDKTYAIFIMHAGKVFCYNTDINSSPQIGFGVDWSESILIELELKRFKLMQAVNHNKDLVILVKMIAPLIFKELLAQMSASPLHDEYQFAIDLQKDESVGRFFDKPSSQHAVHADDPNYVIPPSLTEAAVLMLSNDNLKLTAQTDGIFNIYFKVNNDVVKAFAEMRNLTESMKPAQGQHVSNHGFKRSH